MEAGGQAQLNAELRLTSGGWGNGSGSKVLATEASGPEPACQHQVRAGCGLPLSPV